MSCCGMRAELNAALIPPAEHRPRHRNSEHKLPRGSQSKSRAGIIRGPVKKEQVTERAP
ncbi:hypothetical protein QR685DRAFT_556034 [Neurospora intermedia]|uniref:Uncharacterized protein n=1 Tax=Neurospora intermedia TaxID=5142 RepID=A0ABR3D5Z0_NEUIN